MCPAFVCALLLYVPCFCMCPHLYVPPVCMCPAFVCAPHSRVNFGTCKGMCSPPLFQQHNHTLTHTHTHSHTHTHVHTHIHTHCEHSSPNCCYSRPLLCPKNASNIKAASASQQRGASATSRCWCVCLCVCVCLWVCSEEWKDVCVGVGGGWGGTMLSRKSCIQESVQKEAQIRCANPADMCGC